MKCIASARHGDLPFPELPLVRCTFSMDAAWPLASRLKTDAVMNYHYNSIEMISTDVNLGAVSHSFGLKVNCENVCDMRHAAWAPFSHLAMQMTIIPRSDERLVPFFSGQINRIR